VVEPTMDVTDGVHDVVCYRRLRGVSYPQIQYEIEANAPRLAWPSPLSRTTPPAKPCARTSTCPNMK
jgi:hypothetical protein